MPTAPSPLPPSTRRRAGTEVRTRQRLVQVALGRVEADLILRGATVLCVQTLQWKADWDIVISGERIAWTGPRGGWPGRAARVIDVGGRPAVPGFGEAHKHIESTMLSPEYEADLVLRFGTTWNVEASHEFSNVNGARNLEFWQLARQHGSPFKIFPSLGSATPPTGWEKSGGYYGYDEIREQIERDPWVTGIDEVMDWAAVINPANPGHARIWENMEATLDTRGVIEGHGHGLTDLASIAAFAATGISGDHEARTGAEAWDKLERGLFIEARPDSAVIFTHFLERGLRDWSGVCVTTDDRNAETTLRRGAMDHNIRCAIDHGVPVETAYTLGGYNVARHFRIEHWVGSISPGRYADIVFVGDPAKVDVEEVYADGRQVFVGRKMVVAVPAVPWPAWATKTVNLGGVITPGHFAVPAPPGRTSVTAALLAPFHFEPDFMTADLPVEGGLVQRDEAQRITKVALLDRHSGRTGVSRMFWRNVGTSTPDSALACSILHDSHHAWVTGSSDAAMALAVTAMAANDGGFVLVREGRVAAAVRLEIAGLMTARPAEAFRDDLLAMRAVMREMTWMEGTRSWLHDFLGVEYISEALSYGFLTCPPWHWTLIPPTDAVPDGLLNIRTGATHPVVW